MSLVYLSLESSLILLVQFQSVIGKPKVWIISLFPILFSLKRSVLMPTDINPITFSVRHIACLSQIKKERRCHIPFNACFYVHKWKGGIDGSKISDRREGRHLDQECQLWVTKSFSRGRRNSHSGTGRRRMGFAISRGHHIALSGAA